MKTSNEQGRERERELTRKKRVCVRERRGEKGRGREKDGQRKRWKLLVDIVLV